MHASIFSPSYAPVYCCSTPPAFVEYPKTFTTKKKEHKLPRLALSRQESSHKYVHHTLDARNGFVSPPLSPYARTTWKQVVPIVPKPASYLHLTVVYFPRFLRWHTYLRYLARGAPPSLFGITSCSTTIPHHIEGLGGSGIYHTTITRLFTAMH